MFNNETKVQKHQKKSNNAFKVFQKAVADLAGSTVGIDDDIAVEEEIIAKATESKNGLIAIRDKNIKLVNKINEFFELE